MSPRPRRRLAALGIALAVVVAPARGEAPRRIVTLAPHLAELVCAVGACDRLVGVVAWSDHPAEIQTRPQVGDAFSVNIEAVLALTPDLVLAWDGGTPPGTTHRLRELGLRVLPLTTRRLADIGVVLRDLGERLGTGDTARMVAERFESGVEELRTAHAGVRPLRVLYQIELRPIFTINRDSPISEAIAVCGGRNVFADLPAIAGPVSLEAVIASDPEVIVFARQNDEAAVRAFWESAPAVAATRAGTLASIDANLLARPTPRMADGIRALCRALDSARGVHDRISATATR